MVPWNVLGILVHQPEFECVSQCVRFQLPGQFVLIIEWDADGVGRNHGHLHLTDLKSESDFVDVQMLI